MLSVRRQAVACEGQQIDVVRWVNESADASPGRSGAATGLGRAGDIMTVCIDKTDAVTRVVNGRIKAWGPGAVENPLALHYDFAVI